MIPMMEKGGGHVVNIGSMGGYQGSAKFPGLSYYSASKAALSSLTECVSAEFNESKIKFNCLAIGSVQTEMLSEAFPGYEAPLKASEMGKFVAGFALGAHKFMNGKIIPVSSTNP
jgi:short-subunit dehydrogenase